VRPVPTAVVAAGSLIGGYVVAQQTGVRPLGGVVLLAGGAWCTRSWLRSHGPVVAGTLLVVCIAAFAGSHPLAKKVGAWPAVLGVSAAAAAAAWTLADRDDAAAGGHAG
jgi:thiol:disulfide interchange protein